MGRGHGSPGCPCPSVSLVADRDRGGGAPDDQLGTHLVAHPRALGVVEPFDQSEARQPAKLVLGNGDRGQSRVPERRFGNIVAAGDRDILGSLRETLVMDGIIECPRHNGRFDIRTGTPKGTPVCVALGTYPARVENGRVLIEIA